jgi:hypothetical protein
MWIGRPKEGNRRHLKRSGEMSQPGIMANETIGMSDDAGYRDKIEILQQPKWLRTGESKGGQHIRICRSTDNEGQNSIIAVLV